MKKLSIRIKLILLVLLVLIPLIALQGIRIFSDYRERIRIQYTSLEITAEVLASSMVSYIEDIWTLQGVMGSHLTDVNLSEKEIQDYLIKVNDFNDLFLSFNWVLPNGLVIASSRPQMEGEIITDRYFYKRILNGEEKVISELITSRVGNEPIVMVARAIYKEGDFEGIITSAINIGKLSNRMPSVNMNSAMRFAFIDNSGMIVYKSNENTDPIEARSILHNSTVWKALDGKIVKFSGINLIFDSEDRMGIHYPVDKIGWACSVWVQKQDAMHITMKSLENSIVILVLISAFSLSTAWIFGGRLLNPLKKLKKTAESMKEGDYSVRTNIKGNDEILKTAEAFDSMAESIQRYDAMKYQFFINLSHELKTPLNVILVSVQLLERTSYYETDSKFNLNINILRQNCYRLIRMINNLLDISKYDGGVLKLKPVNGNIVNVTEDIVMSVVKYAQSKEIEIVFDTDIEEKIMSFDPDMIERILLNLLSNAIKFTDKGGKVFINFYDKGEYIQIAVKDTGAGIPEDKINYVFDRFIQVDTTLSRNHEGSGLGLSIVKVMVEAHHGRISVNSKYGEGTEFVVDLPVKIIKEAEQENVKQHHHSFIERIRIEFSDIYDIKVND